MNLHDIVTQLEKYVTKDSFEPVRNLVYGFTGIALTAVVVKIMMSINLK